MARSAPTPRVVAVLNHNDDLVRLIREALHDEGYLTIHHHIADLRDGQTDIGRFLQDRNPRVVIYDVAPPFTLSWRFYHVLASHPAMKGRAVVLTTNNAAAFKDCCGTAALQVVGSDDDLRVLVGHVNAAFRRSR